MTDPDDELRKANEGFEAAEDRLSDAVRAAGRMFSEQVVRELVMHTMQRNNDADGRPSVQTGAQVLQLVPYLAGAIAKWYLVIAAQKTKEPIEIEEAEGLVEEISTEVSAIVKRSIERRWPGSVGSALDCS
jgi:hypothetical protein